LGCGVVKAMQMPQKFGVHHPVAPISKEGGSQPIDTETCCDLQSTICRKGDPGPTILRGDPIDDAGKLDRHSECHDRCKYVSHSCDQYAEHDNINDGGTASQAYQPGDARVSPTNNENFQGQYRNDNQTKLQSLAGGGSFDPATNKTGNAAHACE